jgi:3-methyladenine DNA glycosylase AlkD
MILKNVPPEKEDHIKDIIVLFESHGNVDKAPDMKAYMKNKFEFLGIQATLRRELQRPWLRKGQITKGAELKKMVKALWEMQEREYQYFAMEIYYAHQRPEIGDIREIEQMITQKSWWDTVDYIAAWILGRWLHSFPEERERVSNKWLQSGNIWLQRSCILFQLKYKRETDTTLLEKIILQCLGSKEFFINKAIGWALREYSKTDPAWVLQFCATHPLHSLSKREALKVILKKKNLNI